MKHLKSIPGNTVYRILILIAVLASVVTLSACYGGIFLAGAIVNVADHLKGPNCTMENASLRNSVTTRAGEVKVYQYTGRCKQSESWAIQLTLNENEDNFIRLVYLKNRPRAIRARFVDPYFLTLSARYG